MIFNKSISAARYRYGEQLWGLGLSAPAFILMTLLMLIPIALTLLLSLTDWQLGMGHFSWVGFKNYESATKDPVFWQSILNTSIYVAVVMAGSIGLGLFLALTINSLNYGKGFYRALFFLPVMASLVAMTVVWEFLLHPEFGLINQLFKTFDGAQINWLREEYWALAALCVIGIWHQAGFNMVLFMAALDAIPKSLYEAADMDGVPPGFSLFRNITWPLLGPITIFIVVMTAIKAFQVFDTVQILTQGGPNYSSEVLLLTIYKEGFEYFRTGYAAALAVVFLAVTILITLIKTLLLEKKLRYE